MAFRLLGRVIRPLIAIAITTYVLWRADPSAVLASAARADFRWIVLAMALVVADRTLMAYRWVALLCTIEKANRPPLRSVIRVFFVSTFVGTFLPASVGGDAARAYALARLRVATGQAVASVLMDRLIGVVSILIVGIAGLMTARSGDPTSTRAIEVSLVVAGGLSIAASLVVFSERAAGMAHTIALRAPFSAVRRMATDLTRATRAYGHHRVALGLVLLGSIGVQLLRIVQAYCLGRSLAIVAPLSVYFEFVPLILLVMLLPVSINGIGPSQAAFVWFFGRAAVPEADAFALSVLFVGLGIVGNLPGGLLYAFGPARALNR